MLGGLVRLSIFALMVALATWGVTELLAVEGRITIAFGGTEYLLTPFAATILLIAAAAALLVAIWFGDLILSLVLFLLGDAAAVRRFTDRTRRRRGLERLDKALMAMAAGDAKQAKKAAAEADGLLRRPGLGRLLNAQAAEMSGDTQRARRYWHALAEKPETALVGVKGLLAQAMTEGDSARARNLAERAAQLAPKDKTVLATLYDLQSQSYDWAGARKTLAIQRKAGALTGPEADRREATLALALAEDAEAAGQAEPARRAAIEAAKLDPTNTEAATTAARLLLADGQKRMAHRMLISAWKAAPAPALARLYAEIEPNESSDARRARFANLFEGNPEHRETAYVRAELALLARDWAGARAALGAISEEEPSSRSCALMAAIARGEGAPEAVVRAWLARALGAPRDGGEADMAQAAMLPLLIDDATVEAEAASTMSGWAEAGAPSSDDTGRPAAEDAVEAETPPPERGTP
ncbi:MAG: heme biosynthesis HemY N-terminal domain-containing protein [Pseudomonadota bacterium]